MKQPIKKKVAKPKNTVSNQETIDNDTLGSIDLNEVGETSRELLPITGIGDLIENVTSVLGIEKCEECEERQKRFNKSNIFPWMKSEIRQATESEKTLMERINSSHIINNNDVVSFFALYNSLFNTSTKRCNCPGLIRRMIGRVNGVL